MHDYISALHRVEYDADDVQTLVCREWLHPKCFDLQDEPSLDQA